MIIDVFFSGILFVFIEVFIDNYIWCFYNIYDVIVIDSGDVEFVLVFLKKY